MGAATYIEASGSAAPEETTYTDAALEGFDVAAGTDASGSVGIIYSLEAFDENGFYFDLTPGFAVSGDAENIANILQTISSSQMTLVQEIYMYTLDVPSEGDRYITITSPGYNGLTDPVISSFAEDTILTPGDPFGTSFTQHLQAGDYTITLDGAEVTGLISQFGNPNALGSSTAELIEGIISDVASTVENSYISRRVHLPRTKALRILPREFSTLAPIPITQTGSFDSAASTLASTMTTESTGY